MVTFLLLFIILFLYLSSCQQYLLPNTIVPTHYDITLHPNFNASTFRGWIYITLDIKPQYFNNTNINEPFIVQFNKGSSINISIIELQINSTLSFQYESQSYDINTQINTIHFDITNYDISMFINNTNNINNNNINLYMIYQGIINTDRYDGFYMSSYQYNDTIIKNAVTQFAPIDARWAYPCWDEPDYKATFNISYIAPINTLTISNMPIISENIISNEYECFYTSYDGNTSSLCKYVSFDETPIMSTYIVFFGICDYQWISSNDSNNILQTAYFPHGLNPNQYALYGLNDSLQILPYFGDLFSHSFPLPKMDSISVTLYKFGAMENYGAITYRRSRFLVDPNIANIDELNSVTRVIGHEIAHQWFGNLVTHRWWNHIWLKEGFATYFEYIANEYTHPELNPWYHFYVTNMNGIMLNSDSSIFIRPIVREVLTPQQIRDVYDGIVYDKAGSILYHLRNYLHLLLQDKETGDNTFYIALTNYLTKWQDDNAISQDLFNEFDIYLGSTVISDFMNSWVYNAGYPVLYVEMEEIDSNTIQITLRQQRFIKEGPSFFDGNNKSDHNPYYDEEKALLFAEQIWQIPIQIGIYNDIITEEQMFSNKLMITRNVTFEMERRIDSNNDNEEYYLFNPNMEHYFRVIYDEYSFKMISKHFESFTDLNQFNIISDLYQEMLSGYFSPIKYLQFVSNVWRSDNYNIYIDDPLLLMHDIVIDSLLQIDRILCGLHNKQDDIRDNFRKYARNLLSPILDDLNGWNSSLNDSDEIVRLRSELISAMIIFQDTDIIEDGYKIMLNIIKNDTNTIYIDVDSFDSNLIGQLLYAALSTLDTYIYDIVMNTFFLYGKNDNFNLQNVILNSFGAVYQDYNLSQITIDFILNNINMSAAQIIIGLNSFKQCYGRELVWNNLMKNNSKHWKYLHKFSPNTMISFPNSFSSMDGYKQIYNFYFNDEEIYNLTYSNHNFRVNETLEDIYMNVEWINNNYNELEKFLKSTKDDTFSTIDMIVIVVIIISTLIIIIVLVIYYVMRRKKRINLQPKYSEMTDQINDHELIDTQYGSTHPTQQQNA